MPKREVYPHRAWPCMLNRSRHALQPPHSGLKPRPGLSSGFGALIEAEKLMQIAFVLPGLGAHRLGRRLVDRTPAPPEMDRNRRRDPRVHLRAVLRHPNGDRGREEDQYGRPGPERSGKGNSRPQIMTQETHPDRRPDPSGSRLNAPAGLAQNIDYRGDIVPGCADRRRLAQRRNAPRPARSSPLPASWNGSAWSA